MRARHMASWAARAPRVVVIGGGLGGLTLARILQLKGVEVVVYEAEESLDARSQGGTLDLHVETGQWALEQAGLTREFRAAARAGGQDTRILTPEGRVLWEEVDTPSDVMSRPEVDRPVLRRLLVNSLHPRTVRWGHRLSGIKRVGASKCAFSADDGRSSTVHTTCSVERTPVVSEFAVAQGHNDGASEVSPSTCWHLCFENGEEVKVATAVLVGADGAFSKVRPLLTDIQPHYTGFTLIDMTIRAADRSSTASAELVGRGSLFALGGGKGIIAQRTGDGSIRVYAVFRVADPGRNQLVRFPDGTTVALDTHRAPARDSREIRVAIATHFRGWCPSLLNLVTSCDDDTPTAVRPMYALPVDMSWRHQQGVTCIGDAAHLMPPFAGAGANVAMQDGAALAIALTEGSTGAARFEKDIFVRASVAAMQSTRGLGLCMAEDGAFRMAEMMKGLLGSQHGPR